MERLKTILKNMYSWLVHNNKKSELFMNSKDKYNSEWKRELGYSWWGTSDDKLYGKTKELTHIARKNAAVRNRLELLVYQIQGDNCGSYEIYLSSNGYRISASCYACIGTVRMKRETALKICNRLNNKTIVL